MNLLEIAYHSLPCGELGDRAACSGQHRLAFFLGGTLGNCMLQTQMTITKTIAFDVHPLYHPVPKRGESPVNIRIYQISVSLRAWPMLGIAVLLSSLSLCTHRKVTLSAMDWRLRGTMVVAA